MTALRLLEGGMELSKKSINQQVGAENLQPLHMVRSKDFLDSHVLSACRSMPVQSVGWMNPVLSPIEGQGAPNRQPPVSPFSKGELGEVSFSEGDLMESHYVKGELNRMSGGWCRTCRLLSLFFFLIMPSVFLADTADAAWGTATVDSTGVTGQYPPSP